MKTVIALRHIGFEDLGLFEPVLQERGYHIDYVDVATTDLSDIYAFSSTLLVVLGGPISATDEYAYPCIAQELSLIRHRLKQQRPLLGICLGSQLIARALGAQIFQMRHKEIGYAPLTLTEAGQHSCLRDLHNVPVLHWHGELFSLPSNIPVLASTEACSQQAFAWHNTLALQFHPEVRSNHIEQWLIGHAEEISRQKIDPNRLRIQALQFGPALAHAAGKMMHAWLDQLEIGLTHPKIHYHF